MSYNCGPDNWHAQRARFREHAVKDVLEGRLSVIGAAVVWGVQVDDLKRWIDVAMQQTSAR